MVPPAWGCDLAENLILSRKAAHLGLLTKPKCRKMPQPCRLQPPNPDLCRRCQGVLRGQGPRQPTTRPSGQAWPWLCWPLGSGPDTCPFMAVAAGILPSHQSHCGWCSACVPILLTLHSATLAREQHSALQGKMKTIKRKMGNAYARASVVIAG